jgi:phage protein
MKRYNTIIEYSDTWGMYEEKGKTLQWVNLKNGQRYDYKNKETFSEFLKRLKETNNMTLKTFSDKAKTFNFTYDFKDLDTAMVAGHALLGYMTGTYCQPTISLTYKDKGTLVAEYVEDKKLNKIFKRICDSFKDYYKQPEGDEAFEERYKQERVLQLKESEDFESLLNKVTDYELELLDYADRLLSDKPIPMDSMTAFGTLEMLGNESISLLQKLDVEGEYNGLADYVTETES